jgi:hypothetical protein
MADNKIEVEWIATATGMLQAIEKVNRRLDQQEAKLLKTSETASKAADAAAGSFNKLEQELKQNEQALKNLQMGTAEFAAQKQKVDALRQSVGQAKTSLANAAPAQSLMSSAITKLGGLAAGLFTVQAAVSAVMAELEKARNLRFGAADKARSVEASVAQMALNIGAENVPEARRMINENAPKLGVTQEGLAGLLSAGISGGAKDLNEALDLAATTLKMTAGDAQAATPIMSGMLSLAATTGNRDFKAVLGQLSQFQKGARGEDLAVSINNMSTALAAANIDGERMKGLGGERTLEVSSVMSQILQDPRMAVTGTALRQMVQKLDTFVPKQKATLDDGTVSKLSKGEIESFNSLTTFDERVGALRQNPELRGQFLSNIENSEGKVAIREIVSGTEKVLALEAAAAETITPVMEAKKAFEDLVKVVNENTQLMQAENKLNAQIQTQDVGSVRAIEGQAEQIYNKTLENMNLSGIDKDTSFKIGAGVETTFGLGRANSIEAMIGGLEESKQQRRLFGVIPIGGQVSEEDKAKADAAIDLLKQLNVTLQQRLPATGAQRPAPVRPREAPLPAAIVP